MLPLKICIAGASGTGTKPILQQVIRSRRLGRAPTAGGPRDAGAKEEEEEEDEEEADGGSRGRGGGAPPRRMRDNPPPRSSFSCARTADFPAAVCQEDEDEAGAGCAIDAVSGGKRRTATAARVSRMPSEYDLTRMPLGTSS